MIGRGKFSTGTVRLMPFTNCCIRTLNAQSAPELAALLPSILDKAFKGEL
jgi:hypothetical protein